MKRTLLRRTLCVLLVALCFAQTALGAFAASYTDVQMLAEKDRQLLADLYDLNIMQGNGDDFRPNDFLTREELFRIAWAIARGGDPQPPDAFYGEKLCAVSGLADTAEIAPWALPYAGYCFFNKLFVGDADGRLAPKANVTYLDCANLLLKLLGLPDSALTAKNVKNAVRQFGMSAGLFDGLKSDDLSASVTRLDAAKMIASALETKCIVSVKGNTVQFGTENGLRRWFRVSSVAQLRRSGVVNGTATVDGVSYLTVTDGESTYRYPYSASLYAACMGRIVCWSESKDGKILSAMRTVSEPFHAGTAALTATQTADGRMAVTNGETELFFARNTLRSQVLYFYNTATGEVICDTPVLSVSALVTYLNGPLRETYGPHALFGLETDGNHTVIRITPRVYGTYDRYAGGVRMNNAVCPADLSFASVPDGAMVAVLFDRASLNAVLEEVLLPVDAGSGAFFVDCNENGRYTFVVNGRVMQNRTAFCRPLSDEALAAFAKSGAQTDGYIFCDGDAIVAVGDFADYRIPYTQTAAYLFVSRIERVTIGSRTYTALHGLVNGKPGCELITADFAVPELGTERLLYLSAERTEQGMRLPKPHSVGSGKSGRYGDVGFGALEEAIFPLETNRRVKIGEEELVLADDCVVGCADSDGTLGAYGAEDLLVVNDRGCDAQNGYFFRTAYGVNAEGAVVWLMLIRFPLNP